MAEQKTTVLDSGSAVMIDVDPKTPQEIQQEIQNLDTTGDPATDAALDAARKAITGELKTKENPNIPQMAVDAAALAAMTEEEKKMAENTNNNPATQLSESDLNKLAEIMLAKDKDMQKDLAKIYAENQKAGGDDESFIDYLKSNWKLTLGATLVGAIAAVFILKYVFSDGSDAAADDFVDGAVAALC